MEMVRANYSKAITLQKRIIIQFLLLLLMSHLYLCSQCYQDTLIQAGHQPRGSAIIYGWYAFLHAFTTPIKAHTCTQIDTQMLEEDIKHLLSLFTSLP